MRSLLFACASALLAAACGDPAPGLLDATFIDADRLTQCLIPASYGELGSQTGAQDPTHTGVPSIGITLAPGPPKDELYLSLVAGKGAFAAGVKAGTFAITGVDATFADCGLCTNLLAHIDDRTGPAKFYFADSGTVSLTSTSPVAGSAMDLHLVEIDLNTGQPAAGGCTATLAAIAFQ